MKIDGIEQGTYEWHTLRKKHIGASEAGWACGLEFYGKNKIDLYNKKIGLEVETLTEDSIRRMQRGTKLEPVVIKLVEQKLGLSIQPGGYFISDDHDFMSASPDGIIESENCLVQIKTHSEFMRGHYAGNNPPTYEYLQCLHEMIVTGYTKNKLCVLFAPDDLMDIAVSLLDSGVDINFIVGAMSGVDLQIYDIDYCEVAAQNLIKQEREFWQCVMDESLPELCMVEPPKTNAYVPCTDEIKYKIIDFALTKKQIAGLEKREKELSNEIKLYIGDHKGIDTEWGKVSHSYTAYEKTEQKINWEAIAKKLGATDADIDAHTESVVTRKSYKTLRMPKGIDS